MNQKFFLPSRIPYFLTIPISKHMKCCMECKEVWSSCKGLIFLTLIISCCCQFLLHLFKENKRYLMYSLFTGSSFSRVSLSCPFIFFRTLLLLNFTDTAMVYILEKAMHVQPTKTFEFSPFSSFSQMAFSCKT